MFAQRSVIYIMLFSVAGIAVPFGTAQVTCDQMHRKDNNEQIEKLIRVIRDGTMPTNRDDATLQLAKLTSCSDLSKIRDKTIREMVSLLDIADSRLWVVVALGNIGPRARFAIPKLRELLKIEDCRQASLSSALAIRRTLNNMGATTPPFPGVCPSPK